MADSRKLPKELAEQIQTIAGGVYVQVEEELTSLLAGHMSPPEIRPEDISREQLALHPDYQALETKMHTLQIKYDELVASDRQVVLEKKQAQELLDKQNVALFTFEQSENKLSKENAAKAATLEIQNKQISSLQQALDETASELERVKSDAVQQQKAEQQTIAELSQSKRLLEGQLAQAQEELQRVNLDSAQLLESVREQLADEQQQVAELSQINHMLNKQLTQTQSELDQALADVRQEQESAKAQEQYLAELSQSQQKLIGESKLQENEMKKLQKVLINKDSVIKQFTAETDALQVEKAQQAETISAQGEQLEQQARETAGALKSAEQREQELKDKLDKAEARLGAKQQDLAQLQSKLQSEQEKWLSQLQDVQNKQDELNEQLHLRDEQVSQYQQQCSELEQKVAGQRGDLKKAEQRLKKNREKFQADGDKARETIKYLRDENFELNARLESELGELENKLTEYRLRFEYAQKQLEKN
ncbi:hypothetical protein SG34_000500 [Thalassomonas viridans]|uniref:Uncharacterized protein n=1 Tax=Thalassomonas viridans TaxID=137584 RepID=A0AAE9Z3N2_9GAMM|nr:hypothetical protein [Thalassomonas viridans]WDE05464.1 hypothetical protein SG34_000500 [Thalassomonas viridans]